MKRIAWGWLIAGMVAIAAGPFVEAQTAAPAGKVTITGWALNMANTATGANTTIRINIDGWSNQAQRQHLLTTFLEKKQQGLLRELEKQPELGRFNFPGYLGPDPNNTFRLGTDIRYAMSTPLENGGRRIVIIAPRIIGFREQSQQPRSTDYPFSMFQLHLDKAGKGEGRMAYATQISLDKKTNSLVLENYASEPVRLQNLTLEVRK